MILDHYHQLHNIGSGLLSIYDFVLVKPLRDTLNALQRTAKERQSELKVLREGDTRKSPLEIFINKIFGDDANLHEGGFISKVDLQMSLLVS